MQVWVGSGMERERLDSQRCPSNVQNQDWDAYKTKSYPHHTHTHTHTHPYTSLMDRIRDPTSVLIICHLDVPGGFFCGATEMNPTNIHEGVGSIPSLALWARKPAWVLP